MNRSVSSADPPARSGAARASGALGIALAALLAATPALAGPTPQPLPKTGACPSGYSSSGAYCAPGPTARVAVPRNGGPCPSGYATSGGYCLASSADARLAVPKTGPCPSGFSTSGAHCLSSR